MTHLRRRLSFANVVSLLALFVALGGGAYAALTAPKNSVVSRSIKNGQVKASDLGANAVTAVKVKPGALGAAHLAPASVNTSEIADGTVGTADLRAAEPWHKVGTVGEPSFGIGGEGDCLWSNRGSLIGLSQDPVAFYKDPYGVVRLTGTAQSLDGSGGDDECGPVSNEAFGDMIIFTLPPAYRPASPQLLTAQAGGFASLIVGGQADGNVGGAPLPAGAVLINVPVDAQDYVVLSGVSFRAGGPGTGLP